MEEKKSFEQCTITNIDQRIVIPENSDLAKQLHELLYHIGSDWHIEDRGIVYLEGDAGREAYILKSGSLSIIKNMDGEKKVLAKLAPGSLFGELALFKDVKRNITVRADGDAEIIKISRDAVKEAISTDPSIAMHMMQVFAERYITDDLGAY